MKGWWCVRYGDALAWVEAAFSVAMSRCDVPGVSLPPFRYHASTAIGLEAHGAGRAQYRCGYNQPMSQTPVKATQGPELVNRLTAIVNAQELDEVGIRRLRREARLLMDVDPVAAHTVLGGLASISGDIVQVRAHYEAAQRFSASPSETLANYATALSSAGEMNDAFHTIVQAYGQSPDNLRILKAAVILALQSGQFLEGCELYRHWNKLCPGQPMADEALMKEVAEAVERRAFSEGGVQKVIRFAQRVRLEAGVRQAKGVLWAVDGERDDFQFEVHVHASPEQAVELNEALAGRIVADDELMADAGGKFVVMFIGTKIDGSDTRATP